MLRRVLTINVRPYISHPKLFHTKFSNLFEEDKKSSISNLEKFDNQSFFVKDEIVIPEGGNMSAKILEKVGVNLHLTKNHPLHILKEKIDKYFLSKLDPQTKEPVFKIFDNFHPKVSTKQNFDDLLMPKNHISRRPSDTYYFDKNYLLRTQMTAHQVELLQQNYFRYLMTGDVYRRDDIDATHYPVFHQTDGVRVFTHEEWKQNRKNEKETYEEYVLRELKQDLEGLAKTLFGEKTQIRWVDAYFPFTDPSYELEVFFNGKWMEVLGCGLIRNKILENAGKSEYVGYAFGMGLERLAMVLFDIPDIRLFWSQDSRFLEQFKEGQVVPFKPFSKFPLCYKDIAFWINDPKQFYDTDFYELVREIGGDLVESVDVIDSFEHPKTKKQSKCYRINYRSMERNLTNEEIDSLQMQIRDLLPQKLPVTLR